MGLTERKESWMERVSETKPAAEERPERLPGVLSGSAAKRLALEGASAVPVSVFEAAVAFDDISATEEALEIVEEVSTGSCSDEETVSAPKGFLEWAAASFEGALSSATAVELD